MLENAIIKLMDEISGVDKFAEAVNNYAKNVPKERIAFLNTYSRKCGYNFPILEFEIDLMHADIKANIHRMTAPQLESFESHIKKLKKARPLKDKIENVLFFQKNTYNVLLNDITTEMTLRQQSVRKPDDWKQPFMDLATKYERKNRTELKEYIATNLIQKYL